MIKMCVGDLVWVPDKTCAWSHEKTIQISGPTLGLVKDVAPLRILVNVDGSQEELSVLKQHIYDMGDLYG
tara:strand:+ start:20030 stop:20239 length:210 start_codon:yes stop_codon:yes gene_type:complete